MCCDHQLNAGFCFFFRLMAQVFSKDVITQGSLVSRSAASFQSRWSWCPGLFGGWFIWCSSALCLKVCRYDVSPPLCLWHEPQSGCMWLTVRAKSAPWHQSHWHAFKQSPGWKWDEAVKYIYKSWGQVVICLFTVAGLRSGRACREVL